MIYIHQFDQWLITPKNKPTILSKLSWLSLKLCRACLFAGLFFLAIIVIPRQGILGVSRYDALFLAAILIQFFMVWSKLETMDELKAISIFHLLGFALEVFKTSAHIGSWQYPEFGYTKLFGVPLFSGFMYASIGSFIIQIWRLFDVKIIHHPPYWMASLVAIGIYLNFYTHHFMIDYRWYLGACALGLYARTKMIFQATNKPHNIPLLLFFVGLGFLIWLAENLGTLFGIWQYPNQLNGWALVHAGKWGAWSLLMIMTFTIIAHLKHIKHHIHLA